MVRGVLPHTVEFFYFPPGDLCDWLCTSNCLRCSGVITNRSAHTDVGGFDPSYRYVVDWEFWYRVARKWGVSWKLYNPTVLIRWHSASETHRFKSGIEDLEETARLLDQIHRQDYADKPLGERVRRSGNQDLARAFLNRAHDALRNDQSELARTCLTRACGLSSGRVIKTLGADPRFCLQMASLALAPRTAARWFARGR
jgi:hypothetical protein